MVSESFDRNLPFRRRMTMWMHLLMCGHCSRFRKELLAICRAARNGDGSEATTEEPCLPESTRSRIKRALRKSVDESP